MPTHFETQGVCPVILLHAAPVQVAGETTNPDAMQYLADILDDHARQLEKEALALKGRATLYRVMISIRRDSASLELPI